MMIKAVFFDMGGVIVRTEFQAPREHLAERLGVEYDELVKLVFESETARKVSIGLLSEEEQWAAVIRKLNLPESEIQAIRTEFFGGDVVDLELLDFIRSLRKKFKVGLISNATLGLRPWIISKKFEDVFDAMIISAEVGVEKPDARIYQMALEKLGVAARESVFLDDFLENVKGAQAVGMQAIHFVQPQQALKELNQLLNNHN